jgi:hypothetical protein
MGLDSYSMQKPIEGLSCTAEKVEDSSRIDPCINQKHVEKDGMQRPKLLFSVCKGRLLFRAGSLPQ